MQAKVQGAPGTGTRVKKREQNSRDQEAPGTDFRIERSRAPSKPPSPRAGEEPGGCESRERELLALLGASQERKEQWDRFYGDLEEQLPALIEAAKEREETSQRQTLELQECKCELQPNITKGKYKLLPDDTKGKCELLPDITKGK